jgi:hypothetical protein
VDLLVQKRITSIWELESLSHIKSHLRNNNHNHNLFTPLVLLHHNRRHDCLVVFLSRLQQYVGSALGVSKMFAIGPLARVFLQSGLLYAKLRHAQKGALIGAVPQQRRRHNDSNNNEQQQGVSRIMC